MYKSKQKAEQKINNLAYNVHVDLLQQATMYTQHHHRALYWGHTTRKIWKNKCSENSIILSCPIEVLECSITMLDCSIKEH